MKLFWSKDTIIRKFIHKHQALPNVPINFRVKGELYNLMVTPTGRINISHNISEIKHVVSDGSFLTHWQAKDIFKYMRAYV